MRGIVGGMVGVLWLFSPLASAEVPQSQPLQSGQPQTEKVPQSIWQVAPDGTSTHRQSSLVCPADVGAFHQTRLTVYDHHGFDMSCNYRGRDGWITVYLTRLGPTSLADAFTEAKRQLVDHEPDAVPLPDTDQKTFDPAFLHLTYSEKNGAWLSGIWMTELSGWMFEFRATYKPGAEPDMLAEMTELTRQATASAGQHLKLCAKAETVMRNGVLVTDKDAIQKAMMMRMLFAAAEKEGGPPLTGKELHWCAEQGIGDPPVVFWHGVTEEGKDAIIDRVTPVSVSDPVPLMSALDVIGALLRDDKAKNDGPQWFVSLKIGTKIWYYAIYQGRPSAEALAQLVRDIIDHKAKPLGGVSVEGKNITIDLPDGK